MDMHIFKKWNHNDCIQENVGVTLLKKRMVENNLLRFRYA